MKLTPKEQDICDAFSKRDKEGNVHCVDCPLNLVGTEFSDYMSTPCYATVDGRWAISKKLSRY